MTGLSSTKLIPPGAPAWVTPELIADTLATWQPYYAGTLTVTDALDILMTVSRLADTVQENTP